MSHALRFFILTYFSAFLVFGAGAQGPAPVLRNRAPLRANPYMPLPLGAIQPAGWLREMLVRQAKGATGHLDSLYPLVMGVRNGWRGGDGDQWERGPYWLDGLLPLGYILHDPALIAKTKPFIEWTLGSQQPDGYFGPMKDYPDEQGLQRSNCHDWWPHMVMLKVLQQYYSATGDKRVIKLMTNYFRYQLARLPVEPLDHWTFWGRYRAGDNLQAVYWLYNITGDGFLLDLADVLHRQTFDYTDAFLHTALLSTTGAIHGVNLAEGMKEPLVYYQQHPEQQYLDATDKGLGDLQHFDGMAHGLFGADESLHGSDPTQGSELCTAVEMMYTLEQMICISGNVGYADRLERIAFNALPAQIDSNFIGRQYFQQANQVMVTRHNRNFDFNHDGTDVCYGLFTGYTCCTANMHQGWPKFVQNLWYLTPDDGLAAMVYSPNTVKAFVKGKEVVIHEETNYPFGQTIRLRIGLSGGLAFPLRMRIPGWCKAAVISVNGAAMPLAAGDSVAVLNRVWKEGDVVVLKLPMQLSTQTWHEHAVSVERGPIVYALKIGEAVNTVRDTTGYGLFQEIRPTTHWNYALIDMRSAALPAAFSTKEDTVLASYPWTVSGAPVILHARAKRLPDWQLYNESAGPQPYSYINSQTAAPQEEEITLIPYGCTRLRISEFPVVEK